MKLTDLEATFLKVIEPGRLHGFVDTLAEAQGVSFLCPICFRSNGGPIGTHQIWCWFADRGVPDSETPGPGRWTASGTGLSDLTLGPRRPGGQSSVLITAGCRWHGYVRNGEAVDV